MEENLPTHPPAGGSQAGPGLGPLPETSASLATAGQNFGSVTKERGGDNF